MRLIISCVKEGVLADEILLLDKSRSYKVKRKTNGQQTSSEMLKGNGIRKRRKSPYYDYDETYYYYKFS